MAGTRPGRPRVPAASSSSSTLDQALGPHQPLLPTQTGQQRAVHQGQKLDALLGGQLHGRALAAGGGQQRPLEPRPVDLVPGHDDQPQALGVGPANPGEQGQVEAPAGQTTLQQRHHLQFVLGDGLLRRHRGEPHRLQGAGEDLQRHPGVPADLPVGRPGAHRPAPIQRSVEEVERQPARPDRRPDPLDRQPGPLAGHGQADLRHIALQERVGAVPGDQDAELHQPLDLDHGHPDEAGQSRRRQPTHAAAILGSLLGEGRCLRSGSWLRSPLTGDGVTSAVRCEQASLRSGGRG
jgi:hypothetical protein